MITEDYVSFNTSKLLKEKGFDSENVSEFGGYYIDYYHNGQYVGIATESMMLNKTLSYWEYLRPTLQMAMKWLRDEKHYYIQVMLDGWACGDHSGYYVVIQKTDSDFEMMLQDDVDEVFYQTYEEACEAAIKYCLENLI